MEVKTIVAAVLVIIVAVSLIFLLGSGHPSAPTTHPTTSANAVSVKNVTNTISTTTIPGVVQFYAVNVQYQYSGPQFINGINCTYKSYTNVDNSQQQILNSSTRTFFLKYIISSNGQCPMTLNSVKVVTPGFSVASTVPSLPITIPASSQLQLQINMIAPNSAFYGPLTITLAYS